MTRPSKREIERRFDDLDDDDPAVDSDHAVVYEDSSGVWFDDASCSGDPTDTDPDTLTIVLDAEYAVADE
jgi:hypothetical protein